MKRRFKEKPPQRSPSENPAFMKDPALMREADQILGQVDQVASDIETKWGYGRLEKLTDFALLEKFKKQRIKFHEAFKVGLLPEIRIHGPAMIRAWQALDKAALAAGHEIQDPYWMETQMDDGTVFVITNCDLGKSKALKNADGRDLIVYMADEVSKTMRAWPGEGTVQAIFKHFKGSKIDNVRKIEKEDPNDAIPF